MEGMRKFWMSVIVIAVMLGAFAIAILTGKLTETMWTAWLVAVSGTGGAFTLANVVAKKFDGPKKGGK